MSNIVGGIQFVQTFKSAYPIIALIVFNNTTDIIAGKSVFIRSVLIVDLYAISVQTEKSVILSSYPNILFGIFINTGYIFLGKIIKPFLITIYYVQAFIHRSYIQVAFMIFSDA